MWKRFTFWQKDWIKCMKLTLSWLEKDRADLKRIGLLTENMSFVQYIPTIYNFVIYKYYYFKMELYISLWHVPNDRGPYIDITTIHTYIDQYTHTQIIYQLVPLGITWTQCLPFLEKLKVSICFYASVLDKYRIYVIFSRLGEK